MASSKRPFFKSAISQLPAPVDRDMKILDVGCGYGYFLKTAANRGWIVKGVEIVSDAARRSKELFGEQNIFHGLLKEANFPDDFFDAITMWDVLVFVDDPFEDLKECVRILKRGGKIGIRVRNVFFHRAIYRLYKTLKNIALRFGIKKPYVFHRYCFSPKSIYLLLTRAGFENIEITNSPLTAGDPYQHSKINGFVSLVKFFVYLTSRVIYVLSSRRWVVGPSLLIWADKPEGIQN
ncbi:MAG: class I SAM-dependent methyltransferase [Deltaproteobacteria bacterium]|nr:MAG: class I SAM-dependent methyltransferase [Deltaproteobacteria bacterium]